MIIFEELLEGIKNMDISEDEKVELIKYNDRLNIEKMKDIFCSKSYDSSAIEIYSKIRTIKYEVLRMLNNILKVTEDSEIERGILASYNELLEADKNPQKNKSHTSMFLTILSSLELPSDTKRQTLKDIIKVELFLRYIEITFYADVESEEDLELDYLIYGPVN